MESLTFDTTFLIGFQKERKSRSHGPAHHFLENHADKGAYLSVIAFGEYAEGFEDLSDPAFLSVVESFEILPVTRKSAEFYGNIAKILRMEGRLIGSNDLWIAAVALENEMPLVSANTSHFGRVAGLQLLGY